MHRPSGAEDGRRAGDLSALATHRTADLDDMLFVKKVVQESVVLNSEMIMKHFFHCSFRLTSSGGHVSAFKQGSEISSTAEW